MALQEVGAPRRGRIGRVKPFAEPVVERVSVETRLLQRNDRFDIDPVARAIESSVTDNQVFG